MIHLECTHESSGIGEKGLPQLQSGAPAWRGVCDLFRPQTQAAAGLMAVAKAGVHRLRKARFSAIIGGYAGVLPAGLSPVSGDR